MIYLDAFSGYGGFRYGLEAAGFEFSKVYFSEIDKHAIANYQNNYKNAKHVGSITDVSASTIEGGSIDLFTFGWPCQDNSIAGKRKGQSRRYNWRASDAKSFSFAKYRKVRSEFVEYMEQREGETRSGLLHEANRVKRELQPHCFIAENVKGLLSVNGGVDIIEAIKVLTDLDTGMPQYELAMQLFNTRGYLPQNRERVYFVGHARGKRAGKVFPIEKSIRVCHTAGKDKQEVYNIAQTLTARQYANWGGNFVIENRIVAMRGRDGKQQLEQSAGDYTNTLTSVQKDNLLVCGGTMRTHKDYKGFRAVKGDFAPCINARDKNDASGQAVVMFSDQRLRKLTERECERLQGLPDDWTKYGLATDKNGDVNVVEISATQRYKMIGNGVSTPVVKAIGIELLKTIK